MDAKKGTIVVVGSCNTDMVVKTRKIPRPGNTEIGGEFMMNAGGKGANQAVATARLGGNNVVFVSRVGNDIFGQQAKQLLEEENIETGKLLFDDNNPTGVALIVVDKDGENSIVVASGANAALTSKHVQDALQDIEDISVLLVQLEIPIDVVETAISIGKIRQATVVLNPAPAIDLPPQLLKSVDIITPNRHEAEILSGITIVDIPSARKAAENIHYQGVNTVIITLGSEGAVLLKKDVFFHVPAIPVKVVDTTAAGDVFNGALAVALSEGKELVDAAGFACRASALAVTKLGAQSSAPRRSDMLLHYLN